MPRTGPDGGKPTHSQTQIWLGQKIHPQSPLYNMAFAFRFPAELDADRFAVAWRRVVDGSDALRTRLLDGDDGARAVLAASGAATTLLDFGTRPDPEAEFQRWCADRCAQPLPLAEGLVDSALVRLGPNRTGWYLNQHHLVCRRRCPPTTPRPRPWRHRPPSIGRPPRTGPLAGRARGARWLSTAATARRGAPPAAA
jgi:hypothetical protein